MGDQTSTSTGKEDSTKASGWRTVAIPREHGGWSLSIEPVILGLFVSFSLRNVVLACATVLAFMARTPLKVVLVDIWRKRWLERTQLAAKIFIAELFLLLFMALYALWDFRAEMLIPISLAFPLILIELNYSMRSKSRRILPEFAGTIGVSSSVALMVLNGGYSLSLALGLWVVVSARAIAAIAFARNQVMKLHSRPVTLWHSDLTQVAAFLMVLVAWKVLDIPTISFICIAGLCVLNTVSVRTKPQSAKVIGLQQTIYGAAVIVLTGISV